MGTLALAVTLLVILFTKNLVFDFIYQPPYMYENKGTFGHMGGIAHAGLHSIASIAVLAAALVLAGAPVNEAVMGGLLLLVVAEFVIHYLMDWWKMWWNARQGYRPDNSAKYWHWLGVDQYVHNLTYVGMAYIIVEHIIGA